MTVCKLIQNLSRLQAVKQHKYYISIAYGSPDYLLGEVTQTKGSRTSETTTSRVGMSIHIQTGVSISAAPTADTVATGEVT